MRMSNMLRMSFVLATTLVLMASVVSPSAVRSAGAVDFVGYPTLEVTQGVQNMQPAASGKMVPLVAGKRTFVLFYATANDVQATSALLRIRWGADFTETMLLNPLNNGLVTIGTSLPRRVQGGIGRFVFELPSNRITGTVMLKGIINPYQKHPVTESNMSNNASVETIVTFEKTEPITLDMWDVQYKRVLGKRVYQLSDYAPTDHRALAVDWIRRAYPVSTVNWWKHAIYMGRWANISGKLGGPLGIYCEVTNWALYHNGWFDGERYGYGMVADTGGYMRGCADPIHDVTASGPTGPAGDGSYGDDYTGHELGHLFGRDHAAFCGASIPKSSYPYPEGSISPVQSDRVDHAEAITGYDISTRAVYNHAWRDIMTYCDFRWPSDVSYKRFLQRVQIGKAATNQVPAAGVATDRLMVRGAIDPAGKQVHIRPSFVLTNTLESEQHRPGPYSFVMRDRAGAEIERYAFTPSGEGAVEQEPLAPLGPSASQSDPDALLFFHELLPYHPSTTRIDLLGPDDSQLASISAGLTPPTVKLLTANTQTRVPATQQDLLVQWEGADADGDEVQYLLQYSNDDGKTWVQYSDAITETELTLPQENLMAGQRVWLRVLATDGIHTSADTNDAPMTVFNHAPTVRIVPPTSEAMPAPSAAQNAGASTTQLTFAEDQTVTLLAEGYDIDVGSLDQELTWSSDRAGVLHRGHSLSASELEAGRHTITVTADDGSGGTASDTLVITIVPAMDDLPANPDRLMVAEDELMLHPARRPTTTLVLHNQNTSRVLSWNAVVDQPWLQLSKSSGATPQTVALSVKPDAALAAGTYTATVTFSSPELPAQRESRVVTLTVGGPAVFVPLVAR